jgi:hypothetical protein
MRTKVKTLIVEQNGKKTFNIPSIDGNDEKWPKGGGGNLP